jgi:hypothetical protein
MEPARAVHRLLIEAAIGPGAGGCIVPVGHSVWPNFRERMMQKFPDQRFKDADSASVLADRRPTDREAGKLQPSRRIWDTTISEAEFSEGRKSKCRDKSAMPRDFFRILAE